MSEKFKWLQWFADGASGGDGGDGAGTGATSADAGRSTGDKAADAGQRLEKLGVPRDKAEKYQKRMEKRAAAKAAAGEAEDPPAAEAPKKERDYDREWDDFMADPKHQEHLQGMMAARGRNATEAEKAAKETMGKIEPLMQLLGKRYNVEAKDGKTDIDAIIKAATDDDMFFEDEALERGESVDKVKTDWQKEREEEQQKAQQRRQMLDERFRAMQQQAPLVKEEYPIFDLNEELKNPEFVHMTLPKPYGLGWEVRRAYRAMHQDALEQAQVEAIAQRAKADAARVRQANQMRPRENGSGSAAATAVPDPYKLMRSMTHEERMRYIKNYNRR